MKKPGRKTVKRIVILVLCVALLIPGGLFLERKVEQWKKRAEEEENWARFNTGIDIGMRSFRATPDMIRLKVDVRQELLDIQYVAEAGICETYMLLNARMDMRPMGLSTFYPTYSYMFRTDDPDELASHLDIHVREKDGPIGESFFPYSAYGNDYYSARNYLLDHDDVVTTESYHDAADFLEKNYGKAMEGKSLAYSSFTMLDEVTLDGIPDGTAVFHYEYTRSFDPLRELVAFAQNNFGKEKNDCAYDYYGEQYLFETDRYIYLFAYSGRERNEEHSAYLRRMVESIEIDNDREPELPLSPYFGSQYAREYLDD